MRSGRGGSGASSIRAADIGVLLLSAATLMFEITLTRLFSVSQFYHFAFMIVSLAMLGFGASGTWLALRPGWGRRRPHLTLSAMALGYGITCAGAYLLTNAFPFDSFSIAWDLRQVGLLFLHYVALSVPFALSGAVLGLALIHRPRAIGMVYAHNLAGSAVGCLLALAVPGLLGGTGPVCVSSALGGVAALAFASTSPRTTAPSTVSARRHASDDGQRALRGVDAGLRRRHWLAMGAGLAVIGLSAWFALSDVPFAALRLSPYKGLSYALQVPESSVVSTTWNAYSRVDLVDSSAIRSLPGLSYRFLSPVPEQLGLYVDGDDVSPVLVGEPFDLNFADYMPSAVAYQLRSGGRALVVEPRGGLELWIARAQGIGHLTAITANPLVSQATDAYAGTGARVVVEDGRSWVRRSRHAFDVLTLPLNAPYRPVRSGAYSLGENYTYTIEAFQDYLNALSPDGLLVVSRWLQTPPSESLRAFGLAVEAIEEAGGDPATQIVAFRGYALLTLLVKRSPFQSDELDAIRHFTESRAFDLVYAPDLVPDDVNRFSVMQSPVYHEAFTALLRAEDRRSWIAAYPFDVTPPSDDRPFFDHYFRWSQAGQILAELGKTWQPFGGAGYFVLVALLALSLAAALLLIGLPVRVARWSARLRAVRQDGFDGEAAGPPQWRWLIYFVCLGLGYLLVEIPLIQRAILFLGHPTRAVTAVLFSLLLFSGVGSALSTQLDLRLSWVVGALVLLVALYAVGLRWVFDALLPLPWGLRLVATVVVLAPLGTLMGLPFPMGLRGLEAMAPSGLPLAWAANGAASVVASAIAALVALSVGFTGVLLAGASVYALALWAAGVSPTPLSPRGSPRR